MLTKLFPHILQKASSRAAIVLGGVALIVVAAQLRISLKPVPITMQTVPVLLVPMLLGARMGCGVAAAYLALAMAGFPVLAEWKSFGEPEFIESATSGYLIGFVAAAFIVGKLAEHGKTQSRASATMVAVVGHAVVLAIGAAWFAAFKGIAAAWDHGVLPLLPGAALKSILVVALARLVMHFAKA